MLLFVCMSDDDARTSDSHRRLRVSQSHRLQGGEHRDRTGLQHDDRGTQRGDGEPAGDDGRDARGDPRGVGCDDCADEDTAVCGARGDVADIGGEDEQEHAESDQPGGGNSE